MTPAEQRLFRRTQRYASSLTPDMAAAVVRSFQHLKDAMGDAQLTRALELGFADRIFEQILTAAVFEVAFAPVREQMRRSVRTAFVSTVPDLPAPPKAAGRVSVTFNILHPRVIDAVRTMETKVLEPVKQSVRDTIRQRVEAGLVAGENPRTIARSLREVVGLNPAHEVAVRNYKDKLRAGESVNGYTLRLAKYDTAQSEAQIAKAVDAYRKRLIALNAETNARTATLDALKLGQRLSWQDAIEKGIVPAGSLMKSWAGVMDDRERPEHVEMEGETVPFDDPFSNGEQVPGESTWNCRCIARVFVGTPD